MKNQIDLSGQWFGFYKYGEDYPSEIIGEKIIFSINIEKIFNNRFSGKCVEISGIHLIEEISLIEGFIENDFISFQKLYKSKYSFDDEGKSIEIVDQSLYELSYEGRYDFNSKNFLGEWEIWKNDRLPGESNYILIGAGSWEMSKNSKQYGV